MVAFRKYAVCDALKECEPDGQQWRAKIPTSMCNKNAFGWTRIYTHVFVYFGDVK